MDEIRFIAASGGLGGGKVDAVALSEAMKNKPHFVASDAGTTDSGPFSLGSGRPNYPRESVKVDLTIMLRATKAAGIPLLIGSAGTAGINEQVDVVLGVINEIASEMNVTLRVATIYSEQKKDYLTGLFDREQIRPLNPAPSLSKEVINRSSHIVGMMGVEPLQEALGNEVDVVLAGRCSDAALYAAMPIMMGFPEGLAWHAGKVVECGTLVCATTGPGVIYASMTHDSVTITPYGKGLTCTPQSVAAHTLYESSDPYIHHESSGTMDLTSSEFEAVDDVSVRITGSKFVPADTYTVKLEGAELAGYQTIIVGGIRDPYIIRQLDNWLSEVTERIEFSVHQVLGPLESGKDFKIGFHVYGRDAVMGSLEPERDSLPHEVGLVFEATAASQEIATKIAELARQPLLHHPVPEWTGSITGFACLHNPAPVDRGAVYRFNLNHVAIPGHWNEMFELNVVTVGGGKEQ
ncbi:acyclic terpene utilization AtuA family protein [Paraburkholderia bannensis]|uniref:acyclic terpene utilization AtuA family protein n=1 Tax=Paraburkholderia bannensis TaxID=765414 RepID=UPI002AB14EDD|nr:acyclic terpene utilization AtuA family protein [Paraburkholderia bannensis]